MLWVGLTGGIASGKSTVAKYLVELGYSVTSADELAHQAMAVGTPGAMQIQARFGPSVIRSDGSIDRAKLGSIVFQDPSGQSMADLESILHPEVRKQADAVKERCRKEGHTLAFYEIPLLFEKSLQSQFDKIVCVAIDSERQMHRLIQRSKLSQSEAEARIRSQLSQDLKLKQSDIIIWNNGTVDELKRATEEAVRRLHQP